MSLRGRKYKYNISH